MAEEKPIITELNLDHHIFNLDPQHDDPYYDGDLASVLNERLVCLYNNAHVEEVFEIEHKDALLFPDFRIASKYVAGNIHTIPNAERNLLQVLRHLFWEPLYRLYYELANMRRIRARRSITRDIGMGGDLNWEDGSAAWRALLDDSELRYVVSSWLAARGVSRFSARRAA